MPISFSISSHPQIELGISHIEEWNGDYSYLSELREKKEMVRERQISP